MKQGIGLFFRSALGLGGLFFILLFWGDKQVRSSFWQEKGIVYRLEENQAEAQVYTINKDSLPYYPEMTGWKYYNEYTRDYYLFRSYMLYFEEIGGGHLVVEKGTYTFPLSVFVPSNVTITLQDGVVIKKGTKTGCSLQETKSIFVLAAPSKKDIEGVYSGYAGEKNISLLGEGTAIIDNQFVKNGLCVVLGHNSNVNIEGITFRNLYEGHFIELDASKNVTIKNNVFEKHKDSKSGIKEAINLDTPDKLTGGFVHDWSSYDCTPNKEVLITKNVFRNMERAIGTHKYSKNKYHKNISIIGNEINSCDSDAIRVLNWENPIIKDNKISNIAKGKGSYRAVFMSGVKNPTVTRNTFRRVSRAIQIMPWKNSKDATSYPVTKNVLSKKNKKAMQKNYVIKVKETFIRINKKYGVFDKSTEKLAISKKYIK